MKSDFRFEEEVGEGPNPLLEGLPPEVQCALRSFLAADDLAVAKIDLGKLIARYPDHAERIAAIATIVSGAGFEIVPNDPPAPSGGDGGAGPVSSCPQVAPVFRGRE